MHVETQEEVSTHASVRRRPEILGVMALPGRVSTHASVRRRLLFEATGDENLMFQLTPP